jgi:hypothetical protein
MYGTCGPVKLYRKPPPYLFRLVPNRILIYDTYYEYCPALARQRYLCIAPLKQLYELGVSLFLNPPQSYSIQLGQSNNHTSNTNLKTSAPDRR